MRRTTESIRDLQAHLALEKQNEAQALGCLMETRRHLSDLMKNHRNLKKNPFAENPIVE